MSNPNPEYIIFSVDYSENLRYLAKFTHHLSKLEAGSKLKGNTKTCISYSKGKLQHSFLMLWEDWVNHVVPYGFWDYQSKHTVFSKDKKGRNISSTYEWDHVVSSGELKEARIEDLNYDTDWTYRCDQGLYYVTDV